MPATIYTSIQFHRNKRIVRLGFSQSDKHANKLVRSLPGRAYSQTMNCWYIPYSTDFRNVILNSKMSGSHIEIKHIDKPARIIIDNEKENIYVTHPFHTDMYKRIGQITHSYRQKEKYQWIVPLTDNNIDTITGIFQQYGLSYETKATLSPAEKVTNPKVQYYIESLQLKKYSPRTIELYTPYFREYVKHFENKKLEDIEKYEIQNYIKSYIRDKDLGEEQKRHLISAVKFYYEKILGWNKIYFSPKKKYDIQREPVILTIDEIRPYTEGSGKPGEKLLLVLHYCYGLECETISTLDKNIHTNHAALKAARDNRIDSQLKQLVNQHTQGKPGKKYLFEKSAGKRYTTEEIQVSIKKLTSAYKIVAVYEQLFNNATRQAELSDNTRANYCSTFLSFLKHFDFRHPDLITDEEIRRYLITIRETKSTSKLENCINVIGFYYTHIAGLELQPGTLIRPKKAKKQPVVLSVDEMSDMIQSTKNLKHKLILLMLYTLGLRRSELQKMEIQDIDYQRNVVYIRGGKGAKDRQVAMPNTLKAMLKDYFDTYKPTIYVIEGFTKKMYSSGSIVQVVKDAVNRVGINKTVTPHTLRHSIATHYIEQGVDITFVQSFLGHTSIKTTERYTHINSYDMNRIINPIEKMNIGKADINKRDALNK